MKWEGKNAKYTLEVTLIVGALGINAIPGREKGREKLKKLEHAN